MYWICVDCNGAFHSFMCMSLQCKLYERGQPEDLFIPVQLWALVRCLLAYFIVCVCLILCFFFLCFLFCCFLFLFMSVVGTSAVKKEDCWIHFDYGRSCNLSVIFCFVLCALCVLIFFKVCWCRNQDDALLHETVFSEVDWYGKWRIIYDNLFLIHFELKVFGGQFPELQVQNWKVVSRTEPQFQNQCCPHWKIKIPS